MNSNTLTITRTGHNDFTAEIAGLFQTQLCFDEALGVAACFVMETDLKYLRSYADWAHRDKLHERRDWTAPFKGRAHHADWCKDVVHPDMRLIAAAPRLLKAALIFEEYCEAMATGDDRAAMLKYAAAQTERRAAIAKATGEQA